MKDKSWHFYLPAMILLLILWYVISIIVHLPIIPSPVLVMERLGNIFTQTIAIHALYSLWRIIAGVFLAIIIGIPIAVMMAVFGITRIRPRISSISRLPIFCSMAPTHRNMRPLDKAWNTISKMAADMAAGVLIPAQAMIMPRLLIVE